MADSSEIRRLLNMRGNKRLGVKNDLTDFLSGFGMEGIRVKFLETRRVETGTGTWVDYYILLEALKLEEDRPEYLGSIFERIGIYIKSLRQFSSLDSIGLQEVECSLPRFYYFLLYIQTDGNDFWVE